MEKLPPLVPKKQMSNLPPVAIKQSLKTMVQTPEIPVNQPVYRINRMMNKEENDIKKAEFKHTKEENSNSLSQNRRRFGSYRRDRQKSASKSIQRQISVSSLIDHTLKFLNDDMAIDISKLRIEDPLIEKSQEEDYPENQSK